jgi:hypothetical protein
MANRILMLKGPNAREDFWPSRIRTRVSHVRNRLLLTQGHMLAEGNLQILTIFLVNNQPDAQFFFLICL